MRISSYTKNGITLTEAEIFSDCIPRVRQDGIAQMRSAYASPDSLASDFGRRPALRKYNTTANGLAQMNRRRHSAFSDSDNDVLTFR